MRYPAASFALQTEHSVQRGSLESRLGRHQSSMPKGVRVMYRRRRCCKRERRQRGSYRALDRQIPWGRPALPWTMQDTKGKMSHLVNYCQEKSMVGDCGLLTNWPGRYTRRSSEQSKTPVAVIFFTDYSSSSPTSPLLLLLIPPYPHKIKHHCSTTHPHKYLPATTSSSYNPRPTFVSADAATSVAANCVQCKRY